MERVAGEPPEPGQPRAQGRRRKLYQPPFEPGIGVLHVTFFVCDGRVDGFIVAQNGAHTRQGVAIGDDAKKVKARYPQLTCGESPFERGSYPYCSGRIAAHRWLWFGRDPIRSITVATVPLRT
jgi:hypothetical protein